tara:strand:+ start:17198 stop:17413 length:216 start_codon:yes stop_codon:yes gene_type:complete
MEKLDVLNIIEIKRIREILINHPDLLSMFELLVIMSNNRLNDEKTAISFPIEENIEPHLSDHSSDSDEESI